MDAVNPINQQALIQLNRARESLTRQQFKTLRGQILAGNHEAALKGLQKIQERKPTRYDPETRQGAGYSHR